MQIPKNFIEGCPSEPGVYTLYQSFPDGSWLISLNEITQASPKDIEYYDMPNDNTLMIAPTFTSIKCPLYYVNILGYKKEDYLHLYGTN